MDRSFADLGIPRHLAWDDYGPVGKGASLAHSVLAENGCEYIIKGPKFTPDHRYVAANEFIAARLAGYLGLPVLDHCVIELGSDLFFGSTWMESPSYFPSVTTELLERCENKDRIYEILVFDVLIFNSDRHHENLIVRHQVRSAADRHLIILNDHSHCLVQPRKTPADLTDLASEPMDHFVKLDCAKLAIVDPVRLREAVDLVSGVPNHVVESIMNSVPSEFLDPADRSIIESCILSRRDTLDQFVQSGLHLFPNLVGGIK